MMKNKKHKNIQGQILLDYGQLNKLLQGQGFKYKLARMFIALADKLVHRNITLNLRWTTNDRIELQKLQQDHRNLCLQVAQYLLEKDSMSTIEISIMKDITDYYPMSVAKLRASLSSESKS